MPLCNTSVHFFFLVTVKPRLKIEGWGFRLHEVSWGIKLRSTVGEELH